jgi:hypothetical protein
MLRREPRDSGHVLCKADVRADGALLHGVAAFRTDVRIESTVLSFSQE